MATITMLEFTCSHLAWSALSKLLYVGLDTKDMYFPTLLATYQVAWESIFWTLWQAGTVSDQTCCQICRITGIVSQGDVDICSHAVIVMNCVLDRSMQTRRHTPAVAYPIQPWRLSEWEWLMTLAVEQCHVCLLCELSSSRHMLACRRGASCISPLSLSLLPGLW